MLYHQILKHVLSNHLTQQHFMSADCCKVVLRDHMRIQFFCWKINFLKNTILQRSPLRFRDQSIQTSRIKSTKRCYDHFVRTICKHDSVWWFLDMIYLLYYACFLDNTIIINSQMYLYNSLGGLLLDQPFASWAEQEEDEELVEQVEHVLLLELVEKPLMS